jgi:hypothetical protein
MTRTSAVPVRLTLAMIVIALAAPLSAQSVINPTTAEFDPSSDHNATLPSGAPAVDHYELDLYLVGGVLPFSTLNLG